MRPAAAFGILLAAAALAAGCDGAGGGTASAPTGNGTAGPELTMRGVEMTEIRPSGVRYRLVAASATYALSGRTVDASGVTLSLREKAGEVRVTAPRAFWDVTGERAAFPEGCDADYPGGYAARLPSAELDLSGRVLTSPGPVAFSGPGFTVSGGELVWRWREGKADLKNPKTVLEPAFAQGKRG